LSLELANYVGKNSVFIDVDSIALGRDFRDSLHESLESCDVVLALIGPNWLDIKDPHGRRRLDDPADFVRQEIATALKRNIPVTPLLVQDAAMPAADRLPDDLKELAFRNGFKLSHAQWHSDIRELADRLGLVSADVAPDEARGRVATQTAALDPAAAVRPGAPLARKTETRAEGAAQAPYWLTRRRALGASAVAVVAAASAFAVPSIRRLIKPKPALKTVSFDYATVDADHAGAMGGRRARALDQAFSRVEFIPLVLQWRRSAARKHRLG
jgi:hypothetical protein